MTEPVEVFAVLTPKEIKARKAAEARRTKRAAEKRERDLEARYSHQWVLNDQYYPVEQIRQTRIPSTHYVLVMEHPDSTKPTMIDYTITTHDHIAKVVEQNIKKGWKIISKVRRDNVVADDVELDREIERATRYWKEVENEKKWADERDIINTAQMIEDGYDPNDEWQVALYDRWKRLGKPNLKEVAEFLTNEAMAFREANSKCETKEEFESFFIEHLKNDGLLWSKYENSHNHQRNKFHNMFYRDSE